MKKVIDIILFIIFLGGAIAYSITYNMIFLIISIIGLFIFHGIHQQEIINNKTETINDIIKFFKKK